MLSYADEFPREDASFEGGLFGLGGIPLGPFVGLKDEVTGFPFESFEVGELAI